MSKESELQKALEQVREGLDSFSRDEIEEELEQLLEYDVPPDQAATTVIRRHSGGGGGSRAGEKKLVDVEAEDRGLTVRARVVDRRDRTIEVKGEPRDIVSGTLGDETGVISFTSWNPFPYEEGDAVLVENGYAREWNDQPELQMGDYTDVEEIEAPDLPSLDDLSGPKDVSISEARTVYRPRVEATIVDVQDRSGLIMRCPECSRVTEGGECAEHGEVDAEPDLRIKAILDDGDSCIQATLVKEATEQLSGVSLEDAQEMAREAMDRGVVQKEMERLVGKTVVATGRVLGDQMVVYEVDEPEATPETDARELMEVLK